MAESNEALPIEWDSEWIIKEDKFSGVKVKQLTNSLGDSHHLYFTNSGWYENERKLLLASTRKGNMNLCSVDLETGKILQHTNFHSKDYYNFLRTCINPKKDETYFTFNKKVWALNLKTNGIRTIYDIPDGYDESMVNCTADGKYVCVGLFEDLSHKFGTDLDRGYLGFRQIWAANPHSMIVKINVDGSSSEIVFEENYWIGHVNTSPKQPHLLTFCHEGPWNRVDHRIWGFNLITREAWKIRPQIPKEKIGHEYWLADGETIGYHGTLANGKRVIGFTKYDNSNLQEISFPYRTGHTHSNNSEIILGDAGKVVRAWIRDGDTYVGPYVLCTHNSSHKIQIYHTHPRFNHDGSSVVFSSDRDGVGNVYLAEVPRLEKIQNLPTLRNSWKQRILGFFKTST